MKRYREAHSEGASLERESSTISIQKSNSFDSCNTGVVAGRHHAVAYISDNDLCGEWFIQATKLNDIEVRMSVTGVEQGPRSDVTKRIDLFIRDSRTPLQEVMIHFREPARGAAARAATVVEPAPAFFTRTLPCET